MVPVPLLVKVVPEAVSWLIFQEMAMVKVPPGAVEASLRTAVTLL
ncbi:hypothetical protein IMSAG044_01691 [Lactobacillaceae bacterium]|nr:hypothetical protein IMSAG044_01691 [Lactobacillaceae bacterium]